MNKVIFKKYVLVIVLSLISTVAAAEQSYKPMPPAFNLDAEKVLREYPLGIINMQEAFAHHGGPVRKVKLPNGNRGWLYDMGGDLAMPNIYILQFSNDDIVIDVLHKSLHYKNGHSALQYQFLQGITPELKVTGPGPGE